MTDSIIRSYYNVTSSTFVPFAIAGPVTPLLDTYSAAAMAYSFRKLRTAYAGSACRIRRISDDAEADIGFSGNDFDAAAAAAHIGGSSGRITTWYDQSGNGVDLTNTTAADQPTYVAVDVAMTFDPGDALRTPATFDLSTYVTTQCTIFAVMYQASANTTNNLIRLSAGGEIFNIYPTFSDVIYFDFGTEGALGRISVSQPVGWDDTWHVLECYRNSSDEQGIVVDSVSLVTATRTDDISSASDNSQFALGQSVASLDGGLVAELVIWGTDLGSSNRAGARNNINAYHSVF